MHSVIFLRRHLCSGILLYTFENHDWHEIFAGVYFCALAMFCVLRELIFAIKGQIVFSCWKLIFAIFGKCRVPSIDTIFVFV